MSVRKPLKTTNLCHLPSGISIMADHHEEEVLGKAYDSRLMRRMLKYLWPYKWYTITSLLLTIVSAPLSLAGPPLTKAAIDIFLAPDPSKPLTGFALLV